ncbi:MAG: RHS repeat-associated core domain-containing protein, partial [Saprospiraceae bacterium]
QRRSGYRFGFQGQEQDNEAKGVGNSLDFGARVYDPRLGRWLSRDPLAEKYIGWSPYNFVLNTPIRAIDPNGEYVYFVNSEGIVTKVEPDLSNIDDERVKNAIVLALKIENGKVYIGTILNSEKTDVYVFARDQQNQTKEAVKNAEGNWIFKSQNKEGGYSDFGEVLNGKTEDSKNAERVFGISLSQIDLDLWRDVGGTSFQTLYHNAATIIHEFIHIDIDDDDEHRVMGWIGSGEIKLGDLENNPSSVWIKEGSIIHNTFIQLTEYYQSELERTGDKVFQVKINRVTGFLDDALISPEEFEKKRDKIGDKFDKSGN